MPWRDVPTPHMGIGLICALALCDAVRGLPPRQRRVVVPHYIRDLTIAQIARREGVTEQTTAEALARAHPNLRRLLRPI